MFIDPRQNDIMKDTSSGCVKMKLDKRLLKIYSEPELKEPFLVVAGTGTANVGLRTVSYLQEKLGAELFAEIEPGDFFTPPYNFTLRDGLINIIPIERGGIKARNRFYYLKSGKSHDIMFFTGDTDPLPGKVPELASYVLEVAKGFGLKRLYMLGAFLADIYHLSEPTLYGSATNEKLRQYLRSRHIAYTPSMNIAHNLNAWLMGTAKSNNIDAIGLVSEIPTYKPEELNIRACRMLAKALLQMLEIEVPDFSDLDTLLAEEDKEMELQLAQLRESVDDRIADFLRYLDALEAKSQQASKDREVLPSELELPASLKRIEKLYAQAKRNPPRSGSSGWRYNNWPARTAC